MERNLAVIKCPYCGSVDKIIKIDDYFKCSYCDCDFYLCSDENRILLNQAQLYLTRYKFEDADDIYRGLSRKALETYDYGLYVMAEWGRLLAQFEVVYVKSFAGHVSVPTFAKYDARFQSVKESEHFSNIINSNIENNIKEKYTHMADHLDQTYTKIGSELSKTPDYDVFICVKISSATEQHPELEGFTTDTRAAENLYNELTSLGLNVFYSYKSCQGIQYDSQILSALARSKMLLVISTKREYLESAWVQSEWRRWLNFIEYNDKDKNSLVLLIPSYGQNFELPKILQKSKCQYFVDSIDAKNHILETLDVLGKDKDEEELEKNGELINQLLKQIDELKANQENISNKINNRVSQGIGLRRSNAKTIRQDLLADANRLYNTKKYKEAMEAFNKIPNLEDGEALYKIGYMYSMGLGVEKNVDLGFKWFKRAADQGYTIAFNNLGYCYSNGYGVAKDLNEAFSWYKKSADRKNMYGEFNTAYFYYHGISVPVDYNEALRLFKSSAEKGNKRSMYYLGECYYNGHGISKDYNEALGWYRKAANKNDIDAIARLGYMYYNGVGLEKDYKMAQHYLLKASEKIKPLPQYYLGECFYNGYGCKKDVIEAFKWYKKAAAAGDSKSSYMIGYMYYNGIGTEKNYVTAYKLFKRAIAGNDTPEAHYYLGECYFNGTGPQKSFQQANLHYLKAASQGNREAQNALGKSYQYGYGVEIDTTKALKWYLKAAEQNQIDAINSVGYFYGNGVAVKKSYLDSIKWYMKGVKLGSACSQYNLGYMYFNGLGVKKNYLEAAKLYKKATDQGYVPAYNNLGQCFEQGKGVTKSFVEAARLYKKAYELGDKKGLENYETLRKKGYI